jgi:predicted phosphodiesterase
VRAARVAALYDVHGNLPALEAVLAEADVARADLVVVGGDVVLGPMPVETLDRLRALGERAVFIRGNTERLLAEGAGSAPAQNDEWSARNTWVRATLGEERLRFLAGLAQTVVIDVGGLGSTLFCHGSPRSDDEIVTSATPESRLSEMLRGVGEPVVVCGHTHVQFDRAVGHVRVVNAGSVGMPYQNAPGAYWASFGPDVELRRSAYDADQAVARIRASGFPQAEEFGREYVVELHSAEEATETFERMAAELPGR